MLSRLLLRSALGLVLLSVLAGPAFARTEGRAQLAMVWPAAGTVSAHFGEYRGSHYHAGIDIGMLRSLSVRAAAPGKVRSVGYLNGYEGYGLMVTIRVLGAYDLMYAHLARTAVEPGEIVTQGERIGVAGCSGSCSGTHLHFELRRNGSAINPLPFLP